jgi:hypothetical protein
VSLPDSRRDRERPHERRADYHRKEIRLFHELRVHAKEPYGGERVGDHWTLSPDGTSAIRDNGFQSFLAAADELDEILPRLKYGL